MTDVSCRMVLDMLEYLDGQGHSGAAFLARFREQLTPEERSLPELSDAGLRRTRNFIPWRPFIIMVEQWSELLGTEGVRAWAHYSVESDTARWTQIFPYALRLLTSPSQIYWLACRAGSINFPRLFSKQLRLPDGRLQLDLKLPQDYAPSTAFFHVTHAMLTVLPRLMRLDVAIVGAEIEPRSARYVITPPPSYTLWALFARKVRAFFSVRTLIRELSTREDQTHESFARLREAHAELEEKVSQRTQALEKQVEALREAENIAHLGRWEWRVADNKFTLSEECLRICGLDPKVQAPREKLRKAIMEEDRERVDTMLRRVWEGSAPLDLELRLRHGDGSVRHAHLRGVVYRDASGRPERLVGTAHDITLRKQYEQSIVQAMLTADAASRTKSAFLANVSHEIRTPMTAVLGFTDLLAGDRLTPEKRRQYVERIRRNGHHLLALIDDLLDLSKIEAGRMIVDAKQFSPATEIMQVVESLKEQAERRHLSLSLEVEPGLPEEMVSDQLRFRQVLLNMVGNALKFTDTGGVVVRAGLRDDPTGSMIEVSVTDSGIGIPEELQHTLFKPFSQAKSPDSPARGGSGLGLTLARDLARALGGDLTLLESRPHEGSTFVVRVRVGDVSREPNRVPPSAEPRDKPIGAPASDESSSRTLRVFVVEDNEDIRELVQCVLEAAGFAVSKSESAEDALPRIMSERPDLVLMDMSLVALDGMHATQILRERGYRRPIIALTAFASNEERASCLSAGCDDFLAKPVDRETLIRTARKWAGRA